MKKIALALMMGMTTVAFAQLPPLPKPDVVTVPGLPMPIPKLPLPPVPLPKPPQLPQPAPAPMPRVSAPLPNNKPLPPGQAKKVYGEQSARNFAPGHNKAKHQNKRSMVQTTNQHPVIIDKPSRQGPHGNNKGAGNGQGRGRGKGR